MRGTWGGEGTAALVALAALVAVSGCNKKESDLLVAYSGDCQAYIEPCG